MAVLSLMAMPFGLETWPLKAMGFCIDLMVDAGIWVSSWPGAVSAFSQSQEWHLCSWCGFAYGGPTPGLSVLLSRLSGLLLPGKQAA